MHVRYSLQTLRGILKNSMPSVSKSESQYDDPSAIYVEINKRSDYPII